MMARIPGGGTSPIMPGNRVMGQTTGAGMLGAAGTGAAIGLTIGTAIIAANLVQFEKGEADMKTAGERLNAVRNMTPEQAGEARKLVEQQRGVVNETNKAGFFESAMSIFGNDFGRGAAQMVGAAPSDTEVKTQANFLAEMESKLAMLERAAKSMESASGNLNGAAGKTAMNVPNRGATPSPIKPY
jgi:hypothetical protein